MVAYFELYVLVIVVVAVSGSSARDRIASSVVRFSIGLWDNISQGAFTFERQDAVNNVRAGIFRQVIERVVGVRVVV